MSPLKLTTADRPEYVKQYFDLFLDEYRLRGQVDLEYISNPVWTDMWMRLKQIAFNRSGAEVSEIGTSWLESLVGMNTLRPFTSDEIAQIGGGESFVPALWQSARISSDKRLWAIPWMADTRIIYFWRDLLENAGVDPETAFQSPENMEAAFERLQAHGLTTPWSVPTTHSSLSLHHIASWIWREGGDFLSEDGKHVRFMEPEAIQGMVNYFQLGRFAPNRGEPLTDVPASLLFQHRQTAAWMSGLWTLRGFEVAHISEETLSHLGAALPPGPAFVGGSCLVVWQHTLPRLEPLAIKLITLLTSEEVMWELYQISGNLPARLSVLRQPLFTDNGVLRAGVSALRNGRSTPSVPLWGVIEERLGVAFRMIWDNLRAFPDKPIERIVRQHLEPLAQRLEHMLNA